MHSAVQNRSAVVGLSPCHSPAQRQLGLAGRVFASGVFGIAATAFVASLGCLANFAQTGGDELGQVLGLVIFTVPGVMLGGQIAPFVSGRSDKQKLERVLAI